VLVSGALVLLVIPSERSESRDLHLVDERDELSRWSKRRQLRLW
jgi:hypothetical protein